jgi:hypothetical protein
MIRPADFRHGWPMSVTFALGAAISAFVAFALLLTSAPASAGISNPFGIQCEQPGRTIGNVVAAGGDFDGDGIGDVAYSAPCAKARGEKKAGLVFVRSGADGSPLKKIRGAQLEGFTGAALAFVGDINNDGKDDLAVGTPGYTVLATESDSGLELKRAGKVEIFSHNKSLPIKRVFGSVDQAEFGASVAAYRDVDDDGRPDYLVGAISQKNPDNNKSTGAIHIVSGKEEAVLQSRFGEKGGQKFGLVLKLVGPDDLDEPDVLATSARTLVGGVLEAGYFQVLPGSDINGADISAAGGAAKDRLGESGDSSGQDGSFILGAPGRTVDGIKKAGGVVLYDEFGTPIFEIADIEPQAGAEFGTGVAAIGDVNDDGTDDYAVGAPFFDITDDVDLELLNDAGALSVVDGTDGSVLWDLLGTKAFENVGYALAGGLDWDDDGTPDFVAGFPGDAPRKRRGAGSVRVLSGDDGSELAKFIGKRGQESRIFVFLDGRVRGYDIAGKPRNPNAKMIAKKGGDSSIAVLASTDGPPDPGAMVVLAAGGHDAKTARVVLFLADRRRKIVGEFDAFDQDYKGGVNVAGADLANDGVVKIVAVQADAQPIDNSEKDAPNGPILGRIFGEIPVGVDGDTNWIAEGQFIAFDQDDSINVGTEAVPFLMPIELDGANLVVGNVAAPLGQEIVVSVIEGTPVVRILDSTGQTKVAEWLAYDPSVANGVSIGLADLTGTGRSVIVTSPRDGSCNVRAFDGTGLAVNVPGTSTPINFNAYDPDISAGCRVAGADVDYDGRQEILVIPGPGENGEVLAFEADGSPVEGYTPFAPFGGVSTSGAIVGTDRFVRK